VSFDILLPVVSKEGPELAQGVFRNVTVNPGTWDAAAYCVLAGYLASIWAEVKHPSYPLETIPRYGVTGEQFFDAAVELENFQVSSVEVDVRSYPQGDDLVFGENPLIYAGRCAFFVSSAAKADHEWLITPQHVSVGFQAAVGFSVGPPNGSQPFVPPTFGAKNFQEGTTLLQGIHPIANTTGFTFDGFIDSGFLSINGDAGKQPTSKTLALEGGISNTLRAMYPIQWVNHNRSVFVPPSPVAHGFWLQLKEGVIADVFVHGTRVEPGVEAGSSESGGFTFNPMKGELLP
jgi:hypothetical protein